MPTGPEAFLRMPSISWLRPCVWTHLKKGLVPHSSGWWDGRQILLISTNGIQLIELTSAGRGVCVTDLVGFVSSLDIPRASEGGGATFLRECRRRPRFFWECIRTHLKKALCNTCLFGGALDKYCWFNKLINIRTDLTRLAIQCLFVCIR